MSDAEAQPEQPARDESASGLRRAMEHRMASLQEAEERLQREQSALQEQAKVVFAEREARLARRERELAKREAALAVSEGIASSNTGEDVGAAERAHIEGNARLEERQAELDRREQALVERERDLAAAAMASPTPAADGTPPVDNARHSALEEAVPRWSVRSST